jgi:shikimate dehydrogenase
MAKKTITGIIGFPLSHTLSPVMHNAVYKKYKMNWEYKVFETKPEDVPAVIDKMRKEKIRGLNVTIPHKHAVMPLLDKIDRAAVEIGAVNTVVNDKGILTGYNTDYLGFLETLKKAGISLKGKKVVMFGAGGAAHAIGYAINSLMPAGLFIFNIDALMTKRLVKQLKLKKVKAASLKKTVAKDKIIASADFVINCTSVGMHGNQVPYEINMLKKGAVVYDIIYNPEKTEFLLRAEVMGAKIMNGLDMLIYQGMESFRLWTGKNSDYKLARKKTDDFFEKK